jgi:hypothetical protein
MSRNSRLISIFAWIALSATPAIAQFVLKMRPASSPPQADGEIRQEEWQAAAVARDFVQYEPNRGIPSTVKTEVLVLYDATHLYVASGFGIRSHRRRN